MAVLRRRQANVPGGRPRRFPVKVSAAEEAELRRLAAERGVTVPRLLVSAALRPDTRAGLRRDDITDVLRMLTYLGAISNNVNQLAKVANSTGELADETAVTLGKVREAATRLQGALDRVEALS